SESGGLRAVALTDPHTERSENEPGSLRLDQAVFFKNSSCSGPVPRVIGRRAITRGGPEMAAARPNPFRHHVRHLLGSVPAAALTGGQLLERFLVHRDETAVEVLVRRYGPLVFGVCRRVLHNAHAAEDVFQAAFLVLVRKAPSLDRSKPLGSWLYTVAYRLAL